MRVVILGVKTCLVKIQRANIHMKHTLFYSLQPSTVAVVFNERLHNLRHLGNKTHLILSSPVYSLREDTNESDAEINLDKTACRTKIRLFAEGLQQHWQISEILWRKHLPQQQGHLAYLLECRVPEAPKMYLCINAESFRRYFLPDLSYIIHEYFCWIINKLWWNQLLVREHIHTHKQKIEIR
jgi:hypothetical protein